METTKQTMNELDITEKDYQESKYQTRRNIKKKINEKFQKETEKKGKDRHKVQHLFEGIKGKWTPGERPEYMN